MEENMVVLAPGDENTVWADRFVLLDDRPVVKAIFDLSACPEAERPRVIELMRQQMGFSSIRLMHKASGIEVMTPEEEAKWEYEKMAKYWEGE
jgi:hypothetical protein